MKSDEKTSENIARFDASAADWDKPHRVEIGRDIARRLREEIDIQEDWSILDFGCGTGCVLLPLAEHVSKATGADTSGGMVDILRRKAAKEGLENVTSICADILSEPLPQRFDFVYSSMVFHHLAEPGKAIVRLAELLKPGGLLAVVDLELEDGSFHGADRDDVPHHGINPDDLEHAATAAGLEPPTSGRLQTLEKEVDGRKRTFPLFLFKARKP